MSTSKADTATSADSDTDMDTHVDMDTDRDTDMDADTKTDTTKTKTNARWHGGKQGGIGGSSRNIITADLRHVKVIPSPAML